VVTLGEGETPLLPLDRIAARFGIESVFGKAEFMNPTQSYKDRTNAVSVSLARQFGFDKVCCISSGNHGVSVAAYAAAAGLRALVLLSKSTPPRIIDEIRYYGADAVVIDPASAHSSVLELVERLHVEHGWFISNRNDPLPSGRRFGNPFGLEGYKTIAFEIWRQLGGKSPDWCLMPVGGGDGIVGLWRGFLELKSLGLTTSVPRMVACQPTAGASLVNACTRSLGQIEPVETSETIALSLVDERSADQSLRAVNQSNGTAVAVDDDQLRDALELLGACGIEVEPSSAAAIAGLETLSISGTIDGGLIVAILTGTGLRWPATFGRLHSGKASAPNMDSLSTVLKL
jgi:threonine synthase